MEGIQKWVKVTVLDFMEIVIIPKMMDMGHFKGQNQHL